MGRQITDCVEQVSRSVQNQIFLLVRRLAVQVQIALRRVLICLHRSDVRVRDQSASDFISPVPQSLIRHRSRFRRPCLCLFRENDIRVNLQPVCQSLTDMRWKSSLRTLAGIRLTVR